MTFKEAKDIAVLTFVLAGGLLGMLFVSSRWGDRGSLGSASNPEAQQTSTNTSALTSGEMAPATPTVIRDPLTKSPIVECDYPATRIKAAKVLGKNRKAVGAAAGVPSESVYQDEDEQPYDAYDFDDCTVFVKYGKRGLAEALEVWAKGAGYVTTIGVSRWLEVDAAKFRVTERRCSYCAAIDRRHGGECVDEAIPNGGCREIEFRRK